MAQPKTKKGQAIQFQIDAHDYLAVTRAMVGLNRSLPKFTFRQLEQMAKYIQKSAKLRAPRFSGYLASTIQTHIKGKNRIVISASAFYARFQEFGYQPHYVRIYEQYRYGGGVGINITRPRLYIWALARLSFVPQVLFVSKHTPFMTPAVNKATERLGLAFGKSTLKAIRTEFKRVRKPVRV